MKFKNIISAALAAVIILPLSLFLSACDSSSAHDKEIVMTIGTFEVRGDLYDYFEKNLARQFGGESEEYKNATDEEKQLFEEKVKTECEKSLGSMAALYALCEENGITEADEDIKNSASDFESYVVNTEYSGKRKDFLAGIKEENMTYDVFVKMASASAMQTNLYYKLVADKVIDTDTASVKEKFLSGEMVRAKHVLIAFDSPVTYKDIIDNYSSAADEIKEKTDACRAAIGRGEDFDKIISKYGSDPLMASNTDGAYFTRGVKDEDYENTVFALSEGEVSEPIVTREGVCFIKRLELDENYIDQNIDKLTDAYAEASFTLILEENLLSLKRK